MFHGRYGILKQDGHFSICPLSDVHDERGAWAASLNRGLGPGAEPVAYSRVWKGRGHPASISSPPLLSPPPLLPFPSAPFLSLPHPPFPYSPLRVWVSSFLTLVLQVGVIYPPDPVFSPLHQNCLEFCGTLAWLFLDIYGLQNPKRFFSISVTVPQILVGNKGHPRWRKLVSSETQVRCAADGKIWWVYPCFHAQTSRWH